MKRLVLLGTLAIAACGRGSSPTLPPVPETPPPETAPPTTTLLAPSAVAGTYRMRAEIRQNPGQRRGQQRGAGSSGTTVVRLENAPVAAPDPAGPAAQFGATVNLRGYTRAPRGRSGQAAAWWPVSGDSIVIQFTSAAQSDAQVQLRGSVQRGTIRGEIWFVSASGTTFQLGSFVATRAR